MVAPLSRCSVASRLTLRVGRGPDESAVPGSRRGSELVADGVEPLMTTVLPERSFTSFSLPGRGRLRHTSPVSHDGSLDREKKVT
jgi:hypothetical protein